MRWMRMLLSVLFLCLCFSGCGYRELQERILIQAIGVDQAREGYQVTVRAADPGEEGDEVFTCQGMSVLEALSNLSLSTGREPFYAHNYLVVFGRSCGEAGLDSAMDFFVRYYTTRPSVQVYLAAGEAEEILDPDENPPSMGTLRRLNIQERLLLWTFWSLSTLPSGRNLRQCSRWLGWTRAGRCCRGQRFSRTINWRTSSPWRKPEVTWL